MKTPGSSKSLSRLKPYTYHGNIHADDRGIIHFVNDFDFESIKRFYQVENFTNETIRAFHAHKKEAKFVYVTTGAILLCAVSIDNFQQPSKKAEVMRYILTDKKSEILYIPPGFANGWKTLEPHARVVFFSTSTLKSSLGDDYRFPYDYWGADIWTVSHR